MSEELPWPRLAANDPSFSSGRSSDVAVDVRGVAKKFCRHLRRSLRYGAVDMLSELTGRKGDRGRLREGEFWAAKDVSFQLRQGEAVALIGRNGAGKTTLLRIVAGLIRPDAGEVRTRGRIAPLLSLGAGFNPLLSGRENIFVNMSILGLTTREIKQRFDAVVDFAEIGSALDSPVRTYSSGMTARLGFACAVHVAPDVFIIDEALAVGDVNFRCKCHRKIAELRRQGASLLVVSHSVQILMAICDQAIYLRQGIVVAAGPTPAVLTQYADDCEQEENGGTSGLSAAGSYSKPPRSAAESPGLDILEVRATSNPEAAHAPWRTAHPAWVSIRCRCHRPIRGANLSVVIKKYRGDNELALALSSKEDGRLIDLPPGDHEIGLRLPTCGLSPGTYAIKVRIDEPQFYLLDMIDWERLCFRVEADLVMQNCAYYQPREWITSPTTAGAERLAS